MAATLTTEAWVLHRADPAGGRPAGLVREPWQIPAPGRHQVLTRPLVGCWEGNMDHALRRSPVDVCALRGEDRVVLGNAGVVEVLETGPDVRDLRPGDRCLVFCNGVWDEHGYPELILGYDAPGTTGVLARLTTLHERQLVRLPGNGTEGGHTPAQWAAFSLRHITAWANWQVAWGCYRAQLPEADPRQVHVWAWGGGVAVAELALARDLGCRTAMLTSSPERAALLRTMGIEPIDRASFGTAGRGFEQDFLAAVAEHTGGRGVSVFIDNLGVHPRATMKALARQGVLTTSGWKHATTVPLLRAMACQNRHLFVHTHYARHAEGRAAVAYAVRHGWLPRAGDDMYGWDEIPRLAEDYAAGRTTGYFPTFRVNEEDDVC